MKTFSHPVGFPHLLYEVICRDRSRFVAAINPEHAYEISQKKKWVIHPEAVEILPASLSNIINSVGHKKTHRLFKLIDDEWRCKGGRVFFKKASFEDKII